MKAKTVKVLGGGSIPLRASKNPVLGVFRHHCGQIASVHQPGGKRKHTRYLICDECGTDQCGGEAYQAKIKANTYPDIETLEAAEEAEKQPEIAPVVEPEIQLESSAFSEPDFIPSDTAEIADSSPIKQAETAAPVRPKQAEPEPTQQTTSKPQRVGLAAIFGAFLGGALALVI